MNLPLNSDDLLSTTRAVRKRLDLSRPVPRELVQECVDLAFQAPTGSNRQSWHFLIIEDAATKKAIADLYGSVFDEYINTPRPEYAPDDTRTVRAQHVRSSAVHLRENFHLVPCMVIPCAEGRPPADTPEFRHASYWGSLLPAFWSFMLAARARGLGTAWTTLHLALEREAAEILGIPYEDVVQGGLSPLAYTLGTDFKPAPRLDSTRLVHWDRW